MTRKSLLLLGAVLLAGACEQQSTTPAASAEAFDLPADQVVTGMTLTMTNKGVVAAVLAADSALSFEDARRLDLMGVNITFYDERGAESGTLTSNRGDYNTSSRIFIARENVVLITSTPEGQRRLVSEELNFDLRADQIWTNTPFTLYEADGRTTRGNSFRTDSKLQTWEVTGAQTHGTVEGGVRF